MAAEAGAASPRLTQALADRYRIDGELGQGAMATVYLAHDLKHDRAVAIKVLRPEHAATIAASRFLHEIRLAAQLTHPNVVSLHDSGEADGILYYVMPHVEGESLRQRLERHRQLPLEEAIRITREIADGLAYAHAQGIIHRDIKPENILLSRGHALLSDFGIAKAAIDAGSGSLTSSGTFVGTPLYASPEQASESRWVDARADTYSLACVLYEMLAGEPPFSGPTQQAVLAKHALEPRPSVRTLRDTVPGHVDDALRQAMARAPADRFPSVAEFAAAIARAAPAEAPAPRVVAARGRGNLLRALAIGAGLAAAVFLLVRAFPVLRAMLAKPVTAAYSGPPSWGAWDNVSGEFFSVVAATDSLLVVHTLGGESLYLHDSRRWAGIAVPKPFVLRSVDGRLFRRRLLATRDTAGGVSGPAYSWLEIAGGGLRETERLPAREPGRLPGYGWSDGRETVVWLDGVDRLEAGRWVSESTRTTGWIRSLWGADFQHRQALVSSVTDSLLAYDGIGWRMVDILPARAERVPEYWSGSSLDDGTSIVLGEACDSLDCEPLILQQDTFGAVWHRIPVPDGIGIPARQHLHREGACDAARFALTAAAGGTRQDYHVWGRWTRCETVPRRRVFEGCPPEWPCTWRVADNRIQVVSELRGRVMRAVRPAGETLFALAEDGMLWRRVAGSWRIADQVPGLLDRRVAASGYVLVRSTGARITYEPGARDTSSRLVRFQLRTGEPVRSQGIRALAVRDSTIAILAGDGTVLTSRCGIEFMVPGKPDRSIACPAPARLGRPDTILAIGLLPDGAVLGVGPGKAVLLAGGRARREDLPRAALQDTLWGVSVAADGTATVIGRHVLLERQRGGAWTVLRHFPDATPATGHFAVLSGGNVAVSGQVLAVWSRTGDGPPLAVLRETIVGEPAVSALHQLADGRLVAGLGNPTSAGVTGSIEVWAPPAQDGRSERVALPLNVAVTGIADDDHSLIVSGRGGTMAVPLAALPFARPGGRSGARQDGARGNEVGEPRR